MNLYYQQRNSCREMRKSGQQHQPLKPYFLPIAPN